MSEIETLLGINRRTIYKWVSAGKFPPPVKLGRASRWLREDILDYLEALKAGRAAAR